MTPPVFLLLYAELLAAVLQHLGEFLVVLIGLVWQSYCELRSTGMHRVSQRFSPCVASKKTALVELLLVISPVTREILSITID